LKKNVSRDRGEEGGIKVEERELGELGELGGGVKSEEE